MDFVGRISIQNNIEWQNSVVDVKPLHLDFYNWLV